MRTQKDTLASMDTARTSVITKLLIAMLLFCVGSSALVACAGVGEEDLAQSANDSSSASADLESSYDADDTLPEGNAEIGVGIDSPANSAGGNGVAYYGELKVSGAQLADSKGTPVRLQGVSSHGASWFPEYINYDMIKQTKEEWGCNVFRVAMYTAEYNGYCVGDETNKQALKDLIDVAVQATKELEMYVIIDWHILSDSNPLQYQDEALLFFAEMAQKYADEEHVLYEICNEPNQGASWTDIKSYANTVIPVIREHTDAVVLVGTPEWCQRIDEAAADPLTGYENIMYTQHFYAATHKEDHRQRMIQAVDAGIPVFVSEFGICDASGSGAIDEAEADAWLATMQEYGVSYVLWNLSNKDESSAIISSACTKISSLAPEDLSPCGQWLASRFVQDAAMQAIPSQESSPSEAPASDSSSQEVLGQESATKPTPSKRGKAAFGALSIGQRPAHGAADNSSNATSGSAENQGQSSHELSAQVEDETSWEEGSSQVTQYRASLKNATNSPRSSWILIIEFDQDISLVESWNGVFTVSGSTLTITPESYNAAIDAGQSVENIGFQVKTDTRPKVLNVSVQD